MILPQYTVLHCSLDEAQKREMAMLIIQWLQFKFKHVKYASTNIWTEFHSDCENALRADSLCVLWMSQGAEAELTLISCVLMQTHTHTHTFLKRVVPLCTRQK